MRADKKTPLKADKKVPSRGHKRGVIGYSKKSALLEDAITQMNAGKYGRSSAALKELLALDPSNMEARRLFATLHLRLGSLLPARQAFESLANEALERQDYWLAESLLREYLAAGPRCVPFIEKLGSVYREKGDTLAASEEFAKAIDILIEDPDPDRPTLPAELYAKIRELAPASPPAFRLASLFDAQTGDLIARVTVAPAPQPEEGLLPPVVTELLEPAASNLSAVMSDPVSGVMPWDDMPADTSVLPAQGSQPESPDQFASSTAAPLEPAVELPVESIAPPLVDESLAMQAAPIDKASVEPSSSPSLPISGSDNSSSIALHDVEPTSFPPAHEEMSGTADVSPGSEWGVASLPMPHDFESTVSNETTSVTEAGQPPQSDASITVPSPRSDALPAPLPWEQVQEATIAIPQPDGESLSVGFRSAESSVSVSPEISPIKVEFSEESGEKQKEESSLLAETGTTLSLAITEECSPDIAWSAPDVMATEPGSSSSPSPEPSQTISALGEQQSDALVESVPSPMPWEQIQESPVSIEGFAQESIALAGVIPESLPAQSQEASPAEVSDRVTSEAIATAPELGGPESHDALSVPAGDVLSPSESLAASETNPKIGEFSWGSIFNSAWKFGSSSPAPHDSLHHASPIEPPAPVEPVLEQKAVGAPVLQEELTTGVTSGEAVDLMLVSASPVEAASSPLPWDQIQDMSVTIPSADSALSSAVEPLVEPPAMPVAPIEILDEAAARGATQVTAPVEASAVTANAFTEEPQFLEAAQVESAALSFRFMDSMSIGAESTAVSEVLQAQHPTLPDEKLADDHSPVHSEEFRIALQAEPSSVVQESVKSDAPGSSAEPALATSPSPESVPPVLPQELLPVLQTLVDQLSVVTKTIPAISAETKSSELVSRDQEVVPEAASLREPAKAPSSAELAANPSSAQMPPAEEGPPSQWKTGEVAVQTHRPPAKKRKHSIEPAPEAPAVIPPFDNSPAAHGDSEPQLVSTIAETAGPTPSTVPDKEEWIRTGEAIRFIDPFPAAPAHLIPPAPPAPHDEGPTASAPSTAESAVDVLFQSSGRHTRTQTTEQTAAPKPRPRLSAKLARVRIGLSVFIGSCFSTTRALVMSIVGLAVLSVAIVAMAIGAVGLTWLVMEEKPSPAFQSLTTPPQRAMMDSGKNGYLLLLGFEADPTADPVQAGYERKPDRKDGEMAAVCQGGDEGMTGANQKNAFASVAQGWYRSADPAGQFKTQADSLKGWMSQTNMSIGRYRQWLKMPFEDWGHGQAVTPPCAAILFAHRLHVAEGFSQGASTEGGVERLEGDMEAWRTTLGQAKTLPVKMMALQAINDDIAVASGLLVKPDFDGKALPRITKMLRPLDPVESSMRWPMQSQLVLATKSYEAQLDADRGEDVPFHVSVASMLPLPKQRRFNDYAEYYESSYKAAGEGRYGAMPKRSTYIKYPANGVMDYLTNPTENIIGIDPLPAWDHYNGLVIDTDARLRLASLQAWLRRGPQDADLLARIAKAGQRFYDPYTGLPMLVNLRRGVMYSVGHDGKDQDADPQQDVVVSIPHNQPATAIAKPAQKSK